MLTGIDISNWQKGFSLSATRPGFVIVKGTEGTTYVDPTCDGFVQDATKLGIPWGFYHFARTGTGVQEARYFYEHTKGYVKKGIPVLDFEDSRNTNTYLEEFVKEYHTLTGVFPWVYMNSDFVNNRKYGTDYVKKNCGLWLAGYPSKLTTYPAGKECPYKHPGWTLAAWQFTSSLSMGGMSIDGDIFYGDAAAWAKYATGGASGQAAPSGTDWQLARKVIDGEFGNGDARKAALGDRYAAVQDAVNLLLSGSDSALADAVIAGKLGVGAERKSILGSRYDAVQSVVNRKLG